MKERQKHIHMLGICGTGMTSLAELLHRAGNRVTGSDQNVYPPMSTKLEQLGIKVFEGYAPEHLNEAPDLVIVGNVITKDNVEVQEVMRLGLPYRSMPQALAESFLTDRVPIVIAGTHGKSTLSTLTAWLLEKADESPGFFIGAIGRNFNSGAHIGKGPFFVLEGDEYDTAFFDKGPKFLHYRPQVVILTSIEFDHADIYRDLDHLMESFRKLIAIIPPDGMLIACCDDDRVMRLARDAGCKLITYGESEGTYHLGDIKTSQNETLLSLHTPDGNLNLSCPLFGMHNMLNVSAAVALMIESGISPQRIQKGLDSFKGIARRQEIVGVERSITVIDDFAHHPTAVRKTIEAVKMRYPKSRLWAIFEPRSNTSRRNVFHKEFIDAFAAADRTVIADIHNPEKIPPEERLDVAGLADDLMRSGVDAHYISHTDNIVEFVLRSVDSGDVILVMSNGIFDNLPQKLLQGIRNKRIR